jgi:hypothetical protein
MARKLTRTTRPDRPPAAVGVPPALLADLRELIESARSVVAQAVNSALVLLYWQVGQRIRTDVLRDRRAEYGEQILPTLSAKLVPEYGQGFSARNLARMVRFAEVLPDRQVVVSLSRQLGWNHFVEIIPLKTDLKREFYAEMCRLDRWSVRTLREKIGGMLFERTALSKKPTVPRALVRPALNPSDLATGRRPNTDTAWNITSASRSASLASRS